MVATLLIRFCTLWFGVLVGIVALLLFRKRLGLTASDSPLASPRGESPVVPNR